MWHVWGTRDARRVFLVERPDGQRPLGRPRIGWEDSIKMGLQELEREGIVWIDLAQYRDMWLALVNAVMNA